MPAVNNGKTKTVSGDSLGTLDFQGTDGSNPQLGAQVRVIADANASSGAVPTRVEFWTANSSGSLTKALTVDSSQTASLTSNLCLSGVETGITAGAGGTQANAVALSSTKTVHNITTVTSANDSVKLPAATGTGSIHWVKNSAAANSAQLFGTGTDTIDGVAAATGVAVAAGKSRIVCDFASGTWLSILGA